MKVVVCGEVHSGNLGDGVIADTLAHVIAEVDPTVKTVGVDLSGRIGPACGEAPPVNALRRANRALLAASGPYRRLLNRLIWSRRAGAVMNQGWAPALTGTDLLVLGGGNLLIDNDLNFPLQLNCLTGLARRRGVPVAVFGCGVGRRWSNKGRRLVRQAIADAVWLGVRDEQSRTNLAALLDCDPDRIVVAPDPGVAAATTYNRQAVSDGGALGLGITAPRVLQRHTVDHDFSASQWLQFWSQLYVTCRAQGQPVVFFCNGAPEDYAFAKQVAASLRASGQGEPQVLSRPRNAGELVGAIASLGGLVAHRLHANIIAYALGVPAVGLAWDDKVASFGLMTNRADYVVAVPETIDATIVFARVQAALRSGVGPGEVQTRIKLLNAAVADMFGAAKAVTDLEPFGNGA